MAGFCGKCGAPRIDGARFCTGCGADLSTMPVPCPTCGQPWVPPISGGSEPVKQAESTGGITPPVVPEPGLPHQQPVPTPSPTADPAPPGLPRGPALGDDYVAGQDCGNCGTPLELREGVCVVCGSQNTGPTFNPALLS